MYTGNFTKLGCMFYFITTVRVLGIRNNYKSKEINLGNRQHELLSIPHLHQPSLPKISTSYYLYANCYLKCRLFDRENTAEAWGDRNFIISILCIMLEYFCSCSSDCYISSESTMWQLLQTTMTTSKYPCRKWRLWGWGEIKHRHEWKIKQSHCMKLCR